MQRGGMHQPLNEDLHLFYVLKLHCIVAQPLTRKQTLIMCDRTQVSD